MTAPLIVGHRGAKGEAPENTLTSFRHAINAGVQFFELDVQLSADHEMVVFHDDTLERTTNGSGRLAQTAFAELAGLRANKAGPAWPQAALIPRLEDIFSHCPELQWVQLEIKPDSRERLSILSKKLIHYLARERLWDKAIVTSQSTVALALFRQYSAQVSLGYVATYPFPSPLAVARRYQCRFLCPNKAFTRPALIQKARAQGLHVSVWTVNSFADMEKFARWGVNSVITDYPTLALRYFAP